MTLYTNERGLYPFQTEGVARALTYGRQLLLWDTGLGKTHGALASACYLIEEGLLDHVVVVAEKDKIGKDEWLGDFERFTSLSAAKYHGTKRHALRDDLPQALVTTYETMWGDAVVFDRGDGRPSPGPLLEALRGRRTMLVYDEVTKLRTRTSKVYRGHEEVVRYLRADEGSEVYVLGLTATPIEKSAEDFFNVSRIFAPDLVGRVSDFERDHVQYRDNYDRPRCKNLSMRDTFEPGVVPFAEKIRTLVHIKKKTDPDVIDQFPRMVEEYTVRKLEGDHRKFVTALDQMIREEFPEDRHGYTMLRQAIAYPEAVMAGESKIAEAVVSAVGAEALTGITPTKRTWLLRDLSRILGDPAEPADQQVLVFCFFGPSVLPLLARDIEEAGYTVAMNHGGITQSRREQARLDFKSGEVQVLLSSDAGAKGLNFPSAGYVINYDVPATHALYTQRINRIHRIGHGGPGEIKSAITYMASGTLDTAVFEMWNRTERELDLVTSDPETEWADLGHKLRSLHIEDLKERAEAMA